MFLIVKFFKFINSFAAVFAVLLCCDFTDGMEQDDQEQTITHRSKTTIIGTNTDIILTDSILNATQNVVPSAEKNQDDHDEKVQKILKSNSKITNALGQNNENNKIGQVNLKKNLKNRQNAFFNLHNIFYFVFFSVCIIALYTLGDQIKMSANIDRINKNMVVQGNFSRDISRNSSRDISRVYYKTINIQRNTRKLLAQQKNKFKSEMSKLQQSTNERMSANMVALEGRMNENIGTIEQKILNIETNMKNLFAQQKNEFTSEISNLQQSITDMKQEMNSLLIEQDGKFSKRTSMAEEKITIMKKKSDELIKKQEAYYAEFISEMQRTERNFAMAERAVNNVISNYQERSSLFSKESGGISEHRLRYYGFNPEINITFDPYKNPKFNKK